MGTMTLADFRDELRLACGGLSAGNNVWTTTRLDRLINRSYLWCSKPNVYRHAELEHVENIVLVANTVTYYPTSTYYMVYGVSHCETTVLADVDSVLIRKLDPVDRREFLTLQRAESRPARYSWYHNELTLDCIPAAAYVGQYLRLYGYRQPATLALTTDVTLLRPEWDEIIRVGAEWRYWIAMTEFDRAYEAKQNLGDLVNAMPDQKRLHAEEWGWKAQLQTYPGIMRRE